ncbi:hypothetical protein HY486_03320 [Candidatus Woesearchaeota archaeon]|nr:hypothetical protein [Candidatus Woesearchaeota archaeon]
MLKEAVDFVEKSSVFLNKGKLVHLIIIGSTVSIGYLDGKKIITYNIGTTVERMAEDDILDSGSPILELKCDEVHVEPVQARDIAKEVAKSSYPLECAEKWLVVLQNPGKPCYTITGITKSLKTISVKIDAFGKVFEHSCEQLALFDKPPNHA